VGALELGGEVYGGCTIIPEYYWLGDSEGAAGGGGVIEKVRIRNRGWGSDRLWGGEFRRCGKFREKFRVTK